MGYYVYVYVHLHLRLSVAGCSAEHLVYRLSRWLFIIFHELNQQQQQQHIYKRGCHIYTLRLQKSGSYITDIPTALLIYRTHIGCLPEQPTFDQFSGPTLHSLLHSTDRV